MHSEDGLSATLNVRPDTKSCRQCHLSICDISDFAGIKQT
jgi:hypothetical protein